MTLNKQSDTGIEWTHVFGPGTGYTWNVVGGCQHGCEWEMADGAMAQCYAKTFADRQRGPKFYPQGFEHHYYHPDRLTEPLKLKTPAGIFLDSMSDLMGHWVPSEQIEAVLDICRQTPQHVYQLLTKNAPRLEKFKFPANVWVGVSAPPSIFMGKRLSEDTQLRMVYRQLTSLAHAKNNGAGVTWMSIEPLSFDIGPHLDYSVLDWIVIGAASNGAKIYQPDPIWVEGALMHLNRNGIPVFFKGNLKGNTSADPWREEFPALQPKPAQQNLFEV